MRLDASVGDRASYATGLGKVLLAGLAVDEVGAHLPPIPWIRPPSTTITNPEGARSRGIAGVRRQGYAYDDEEWDEGLRCMAVPVAANGTTLAALSISGAAGEFSDEVRPRFLELLQSTADSLAHDTTIVAALTSAPRPRG